MHTLAISRTYESAEQVMRYHALKEISPDKIEFVPHAIGGIDPQFFIANGYDYVDFQGAPRALQGRGAIRIIIGSDYVRPFYAEPGTLTKAWLAIRTAEIRGAQVVWG